MLQTKEYVPRLFDAFRSSNEELQTLYKQPWERLPEKVCAGRDVYERFAFYLTDVHVKEGTTKVGRARNREGNRTRFRVLAAVAADRPTPGAAH